MHEFIQTWVEEYKWIMSRHLSRRCETPEFIQTWVEKYKWVLSRHLRRRCKMQEFIQTWVEEYKWIMSRPFAPGSVNARSRLALNAYGRCVMYYAAAGLEPPKPHDAVAGGQRMAGEIKAEVEGFDRSMAAVKAADSATEADDITIGLLELRLQAWYVTKALSHVIQLHDNFEESLAVADKRRPYAMQLSRDLENTLWALTRATENFDGQLRRYFKSFAPIAETPVLQNWRAMIPADVDVPSFLDAERLKEPYG